MFPSLVNLQFFQFLHFSLAERSTFTPVYANLWFFTINFWSYPHSVSYHIFMLVPSTDILHQWYSHFWPLSRPSSALSLATFCLSLPKWVVIPPYFRHWYTNIIYLIFDRSKVLHQVNKSVQRDITVVVTPVTSCSTAIACCDVWSKFV